MRNRFIFGLLILWSICPASCDKMETDVSGVEKLELYNLDVQKVKKVHEYYALISTHKIIFLDDSGEKKFTIEDSLFVTDSAGTFKFSFTDVVGHPNGDTYVLATEIRKDYNFRLYLIRLNQKSQPVWDHPKIINITNSYKYDTSVFEMPQNLNFTSKENGYALATVHDNEIVAVVNYQTVKNYPWRYRIIAFSENGDLLRSKDYKSRSFVSWTYLIDILPDNSLALVRGSNRYLDIIQCDPVLLETTKIYSMEDKLNSTMFTSMLSWNAGEVIFTGHADRRNNEVVAENFDILCFKYNFRTNEIMDSLFSGLVNNNELCYHSYIDQNNIIHCIGTKRGDLLSTPSVQSNLLEVTFNLETHRKDSMELIKNSGYEGLYAEPDDNALNGQKVLGYKLDISGKLNMQGFFMQIKNP